MRLIDADALAKKLTDWSTGTVEPIDWSDIADAPTIDAVSVVHGEWIEDPEGDWDDADRGEYECSSCGFRMYPYISDEAFREKYKFCPNCGAKMDGEREGE